MRKIITFIIISLASWTEDLHADPRTLETSGDQLGTLANTSADVAKGYAELPSVRRSSVRELTDLVPYLRNPSFETTSTNGWPANWNMFREAFLDHNSAVAHSGNSSVRSSYLFGWAQDLLVPVSPYQTFTLSGYAVREGAWEQAGSRGAFFDVVGNHIEDVNSYSPVMAPAGQYGEFWSLQPVPEKAHYMSLYLRGQDTISWLRFDDLTTYTEQVRSPGDRFNETWIGSDLVTTDAETLTLPPGTTVTQRVVVGTENQAYFLWGRYASDAATTIIAREKWLPRASWEPESTTETVHGVQTGVGSFLSDPGRMEGTASGMAQVELVNDGAASISIDAVRRGFAKVEPRLLTAGPASPDGSLKLTAALPGYLSTGTIQLLEPNGSIADVTTISQHGTSLRAEWDATSAAAGAYIARFTLHALDSETIVIDRPFKVVREEHQTSEIPPYAQPEFLRGIWLFINNDPNHTNQMFEHLQADGFNFAIVLATANQLAAVEAAAEQYKIPYTVFMPEAVQIFREYENKSWFSKADFLKRTKEKFLPLMDSEYFQGVYVVDEPTLPRQLDTVRRTFLSLFQDQTLGTPFSVFLENITESDFRNIMPPVALIDIYPYNLHFGTAPTSELLKTIRTINSHAITLEALNRKLWILPQGFTSRHNDNGYYEVAPSLHSAQLWGAVLAGAKGTIPFYYSSGPGQEGLRASDLSPTDKLQPYQQFNTDIKRLSPLLMQLGVPTLHEAPYPFAVSSVSGTSTGTYIFALNGDELLTRTLLMDLETSIPGTIVDVVSDSALPVRTDGKLEVELGPGALALFSVGENAIASLTSPPVSDPLPLSTVQLPVSHAFSVTGLFETGQQVRQLEFSPEGNTLAATVPFAYAPAKPMMFYLQPDGSVARESRPVDYLVEKNGFINDDLISNASHLLGFEFRQPDNPVPVASMKGYTGGGYDVIVKDSLVWVSIERGIRQLELDGDQLLPVDVGWAQRGSYLNMFGPFTDSSISVLITNFGLSNIKPGQLDESQHRYTILPWTDQNADLNSDNLLAVPRHQFGVSLLQLAPTGEAQIVGNIAMESRDALATAWITDDMLAVADGNQTIRFYRVSNYNASLVATWRPPLSDYYYMMSLAATDGRLAVGMEDGRVVVAETARLNAPALIQDWQLYAD